MEKKKQFEFIFKILLAPTISIQLRYNLDTTLIVYQLLRGVSTIIFLKNKFQKFIYEKIRNDICKHQWVLLCWFFFYLIISNIHTYTPRNLIHNQGCVEVVSRVYRGCKELTKFWNKFCFSIKIWFWRNKSEISLK